MSGETNLSQLLKHMAPTLMEEEFVFCSVQGHYGDYAHLHPLASFQEAEGLTLVLTKANANGGNLSYETSFKAITLTVHSSLEAVGLTAAVSAQLAAHGISANVIAAYYHDHIFVPTHRAKDALAALSALRDP